MPDIALIAGMYHLWRGEKTVRLESIEGRTSYEDIPGFCKSGTLVEIRKHGYVLTPGRYVGAEQAAEDDESFDEKMWRLTEGLEEQFAESAQLDQAIRENTAIL